MAKKIRKSIKPASKSTTGNSRTARTKPVEDLQAPTRQKDPFGFIEGTDSSIAAYALAKGDTDRLAIYEHIRHEIEHNTVGGLITRKGTEKNIPNLAATVVKQMRNRGWIVESTWRMIKDPEFIEPTAESELDAIKDIQVPKPKTARRKPRKAQAQTSAG